MRFLRPALAVVLGLAAAMCLVVGMEAVGHQIWPLPKALDWNNKAAVSQFLAQQALGAKAWLLAGWALAAYVGVAIARWVCHYRTAWPSYVVAVLFALSVLANFLLLPHPVALMLAAAAIVALSVGLALAWPGARSPT